MSTRKVLRLTLLVVGLAALVFVALLAMTDALAGRPPVVGLNSVNPMKRRHHTVGYVNSSKQRNSLERRPFRRIRNQYFDLRHGYFLRFS